MIQPPPERLRAVLFDMDGVLVHSTEAWKRVMMQAREAFGYGPLDEARFYATFGQGVVADLELFFPDQTEAELRAFYDEAYLRESRSLDPAAGALELLRDLAARGIRQAVVTNTTGPVARSIMQQTGLAPYLQAVITSGDAPEKPAPDLPLLALEQIGARPEEAVYVGDSAADRGAARAAGIFMFGLGTEGDAEISCLEDLRAYLI